MKGHGQNNLKVCISTKKIQHVKISNGMWLNEESLTPPARGRRLEVGGWRRGLDGCQDRPRSAESVCPGPASSCCGTSTTDSAEQDYTDVPSDGVGWAHCSGPPPLKLLGKDTPPHSCRGLAECNSCRFLTEDQSPWGCQPSALIPRQSTPRHLQAHSGLQSILEFLFIRPPYFPKCYCPPTPKPRDNTLPSRPLSGPGFIQ